MTGGGDLGARLARLVFANPLYYLSLLGRRPRDVRVSPSEPWPGSAEQGGEIMRGSFRLAGESRDVAPDEAGGRAPWTASGTGPAWRAALHGFGWLRDLHAVGSDAARHRARELVGDWIERHSHWDRVAWEPSVLAQRMIAWLTEYEFFCASADDTFRHRYLASLGHQRRHLARVGPGGAVGVDRLPVVKALVFAGVALGGRPRLLARALASLTREIDAQVLADGGHIARNPSAHLAALGHLVDMRACLGAGNHEIPGVLQTAIDRMAPVLRLFRHGDGGLALFNGGNEDEAWRIDAVLARADAPGKPPDGIPHSGFQRLRAGRTLVVVDSGPPPPAGFDAGAHAGTLSFELSTGKERLVVNCGGYRGTDPAWQTAERSTAAHSTVSVEDRNSSEVRADGTIGRRPAAVKCRREEADGAILVDASHDGYVPPFGVVHRRRLYLGAGGDDLRGEDNLSRTGAVADRASPRDQLDFAIRFHLHPDVDASLVATGDAALLRLPSGAGWRLQATGGHMILEESIYLGRSDESRRTEQIVVGATLRGDSAVIKWALRKLGGHEEAGAG